MLPQAGHVCSEYINHANITTFFLALSPFLSPGGWGLTTTVEALTTASIVWEWLRPVLNHERVQDKRTFRGGAKAGVKPLLSCSKCRAKPKVCSVQKVLKRTKVVKALVIATSQRNAHH